MPLARIRWVLRGWVREPRFVLFEMMPDWSREPELLRVGLAGGDEIHVRPELEAAAWAAEVALLRELGIFRES